MFSFIETRLFTKLVVDYLSDEECAALQVALIESFGGRRLGEESEVGTG